MAKIKTLHDFDQLRLLADPRRLQVLRLFMASPSTLTGLAHKLRQSPAWVRHHLLALESAGLVELDEVRTSGRVTEKFYRASASIFLLQDVITPLSKKPILLFSGSDDPAVDWIASHFSRHASLLTLPVGSLDGLVALRQGLCHLSGSHLLDESGEYNTPYIRHLFPEGQVRLVTLALRTQGWILARGNPLGIRGIADLGNARLRFVNRNPGSGTRLWIDRQLHLHGIPAAHVNGYAREVSTHNDAAALIASGKADLSLGLESAALSHGLDFIPLFEERYDLVLLRRHEHKLLPVLDYINTAPFRAALASLPGYSPALTGTEITL